MQQKLIWIFIWSKLSSVIEFMDEASIFSWSQLSCFEEFFYSEKFPTKEVQIFENKEILLESPRAKAMICRFFALAYLFLLKLWIIGLNKAVFNEKYDLAIECSVYEWDGFVKIILMFKFWITFNKFNFRHHLQTFPEMQF